jgi:hypothetical protein
MIKYKCKGCNKLKSYKFFYNHTYFQKLVDGTKKIYNGRYHLCKDCCAIERRTLHKRYIRFKSTSKTRNIKWDLSLEELSKFLKIKECTYCNGPLPEVGIGLDRKNNDLGYIKRNITRCCGECNAIKSNLLTYKEMLQIKPILIKARIRRTCLNT